MSVLRLGAFHTLHGLWIYAYNVEINSLFRSRHKWIRGMPKYARFQILEKRIVTIPVGGTTCV